MIHLARPPAVAATAALMLLPPPAMTVSEWADTYRVLSREDSAAPGRWSTAARPYQRGIMDALADPRVHTVVVMGCSQWGKSQIALNFLGRSIHLDPGPLMFVGPTVDSVKRFSKTRVACMIRDCPELAALVHEEKSRDGSNTIFEKTFSGGALVFVGSNAPAGLASQPIRDLVLDELDRFGEEAGQEGAPEDLAEARTLDFEGRRKVYVNSTPTMQGASRIEKRWLQSDQRRYLVPCPACGHLQPLDWDRVRWTGGAPASARYHCAACEAPWTQRQLRAAIPKGGWEAARACEGVAGFHVPGLLARSMETLAEKYEEAKERGPESLKAWWNTGLGLPFDPRDLEQLQAEGLMARREAWPAPVPMGVALLTLGCDTQDDRLEWQLVGWGLAGETWVVDRGVIPGNPALPDVWNRLAAVVTSRWPHEAGVEMGSSATMVDHGGHFPKQVLAFCKAMRDHQVFPVKGASRPLQRLIERSKRRSPVWQVDTVAAKDMIFGRLKVEAPGPGYVHFAEHLDRAYFDQLLSEKVVRRRINGVDRRVYTPVKDKVRNEALDMLVYALAGFELLDPRDLPERLDALRQVAARAKGGEEPPAAQEPARPARQRSALGLARVTSRSGGW